jgi:hypothetical protein
LAKAIITVQFSTFDGPPNHPYLIFSILALGFTIGFLYIFYLPYYHWLTTVIQAQLIAVFTWCGVCLLLAYLENNSEDAGPITLFYIGSFCVWRLTKDLCYWRREQLTGKSNDEIENIYEVELYVRFYLMQKAGSLKPEQVNEAMLEQLEAFYFYMEKKFTKEPLLEIFIAQYYITYKRSLEDAVVKMEQAEKM